MTSHDTTYRFFASTDMTVAALMRDYAHLTFPPIHKRVQGRPLHEPLIAVTARTPEQAGWAGMALAQHTPPDAGAEVLSLFVVPEQRQRGIGSSLLAHLTRVVAEQRRHSIRLTYRDDWPGAVVLERILARQGWSTPRDTLLHCKARPNSVLQAPWFARARLAQGYRVFPWDDLTPAEQQAIVARQAREGWFPAVLDPFQEAARREPTSSLGLRWHDEVIGWMITHRMNTETVQYTSLFITPGRHHRAQAVPLLAAALQRQAAQQIPFGTFQVDVTNDPMRRFLERRLRDWMISVVTLRASRRELPPVAGKA
jgi:GNAT superfamily N-acetyltransferase